ncbi:hypothetical protein POSPLADRAFT_1052861 [Postia placenta MAD-698-R-SB12]|uniref:Uncharacterized protein n=1 Tax=Postia placenta MAD-698-R-SB12 TaxID=670580 RepID=A0A1X6NC63_9APHY|nr:hypothetical protein POSPLADRAFT_1052861 [Postia placenta MAD-698-R-SB12]OSX66191.1 hypothetical protein POSPLADRAFT_1052861 [Postia placenta MAD-698-R-SB12]
MSLLFLPDLPPQAPISPNLSPVQVKHEEILISLEELRQSQRNPKPESSLGQLVISNPILNSSPCHMSPRHQTSSVTSTTIAVVRPLEHSLLSNPLSPSLPVMSSPVFLPDKNTLKLLLPL